MARRWVIYGVRSSYIYDVRETIHRLGDQAAAYIDNMPGPGAPPDLEPAISNKQIHDDLLGLSVVFPLVTPGNRKVLETEARELGFSNFPCLIDPTSIVASDVEWGEGGLLNAGSLVAAKCKFGRFVLVNRSVSIGHHATVDDFVSFGPGVVVCGECTIAKGAFIGAGAVIAPQVSIGENAVIGAGAAVFEDVPPMCTVRGNPAQVTRERGSGYKGMTV